METYTVFLIARSIFDYIKNVGDNHYDEITDKLNALGSVKELFPLIIYERTKNISETLSYLEKYNIRLSSYLNVRLHSRDAKTLEDKSLTMVIVKGFHTDPKTLDTAYMVLFTSRKVSGRNDVIKVVRE